MRLDEKDIGEDVSLRKQADDGHQGNLCLVGESHINWKSLLIDISFSDPCRSCTDAMPLIFLELPE